MPESAPSAAAAETAPVVPRPVAKAPSIRFWLAAVMCLCTLPAIVLALGLAASHYMDGRSALDAGTRATARALAAVLDSQVQEVRGSLAALATSPSIGEEGLAQFHAQAAALQARQKLALNVVLTNRQGQQLVNTLRPHGTPLPSGLSPPGLLEVFDTGRPAVLDLFTGAVTRAPLVGVTVPVFAGDRVAYVLTAAVDPQRLREVLLQQQLPPTWTAAVLDRQGRIIARSTDHQQYLGQPAHEGLRQRAAVAEAGSFDGFTKDGRRVLAVFSRAPVSGWTVAIGIPHDELMRPLYTSLQWIAAAAAGLLALSVLLAWRIGRKIVRSIRPLVAASAQLARGEDVQVSRLAFREANEVGSALGSASLALTATQEAERKLESLNSQLQRAIDEAVRANSAKSEFLANVSHELRTPMTAVLGMLTLLKETPLSGRQADYVHNSEAAARSLLALLDELLDFSRIESGRLALDLAPVSLQHLLDEVTAVLRPMAEAKGLQLQVRVGDGVPRHFTSDALRLRQVLVNLGGNAVKFTDAGSVRLEIDAPAGGAEGEVRFEVVDTGIGIPEDRQAAIFESFTQAEASTARRYGGTGLGLAISRRLVEMLGGTLAVQSRPGAGSRFGFTLRLRAAESGNAAPAGQASAAGAGSGKLLAGLRLLVAEDNAMNRQILKELLQARGAQVELVPDGEQAVRRVLAAPRGYDLVLMDLQMPHMDGFEAARAIGAGAGSQTPIVAITANAREEDRQACLAAGMVGHVAKPFDVDTLVATILQHTRQPQGGPAVTQEPLQARGDPLFDREVFRKRYEDEDGLMVVVLEAFREHAPMLVDQLGQAAAAGDHAEVHRLAHSLKANAALVASHGLAAAAAAIEANPAGVDEQAVSNLRELFEQVLARCEQERADLAAAESA